MITIFKNIFEKEDARYIPIQTALNRIKTGKSKDYIIGIRKAETKADRNNLKKNLPCVCFSGKFSRREDSKIISHSGFVVLDWDNVENLDSKKKEISKDPYTYAVWISPSGNGLKALIKIPAEPINHRAYYLGLIQKYPELDTSNKNESRVCYESYDENIIINENSLVWNTKGKEDIKHLVTQNISFDSSNPYIKKSLENAFEKAKQMIRDAADGTRHDELLKSAKLLGGYLHYGSFQEHDVITTLSSEFVSRGVDKGYNYKKTIKDGINNGNREPLYIDVPSPSFPNPVKIETIIEDNLLSNQEDEKNWLDMVFSNNVPQGLGIGSRDFDNHFRLKKQTLVGVFGMDNVGKTTFYLFLIVCYAKKHGINFLILCRENEASSVRQSLIELCLGNYAHQSSKEEQKKATEFCYKYFDIVKLSVNIDMETIFPVLDKLYSKKKYYACFIDPYNSVQHNQSPKENYKFLDNLKKAQRKYDTSFHLSMHISTDKARNWVYNGNDFIETFDNDNVMVAGQTKIPKKSFVEGGQPIANKLDDIIITHRIQKIDKISNYTLIAIDKVKENRTGGKVSFENPIMFRKKEGFITFIDSDGINPMVKPVIEKPQPLPQMTTVDAFGNDLNELEEIDF